MRFAFKDLTVLKVFKPTTSKTPGGDRINTYNESSGVFNGNIQPYNESKTATEYGINLKYAYVVYTTDKPDINELDRIGIDSPDYQVVTVQDWSSYKRILLEKKGVKAEVKPRVGEGQ